jgi:hypothetical protein
VHACRQRCVEGVRGTLVVRSMCKRSRATCQAESIAGPDVQASAQWPARAAHLGQPRLAHVCQRRLHQLSSGVAHRGAVVCQQPVHVVCSRAGHAAGSAGSAGVNECDGNCYISAASTRHLQQGRGLRSVCMCALPNQSCYQPHRANLHATGDCPSASTHDPLTHLCSPAQAPSHPPAALRSICPLRTSRLSSLTPSTATDSSTSWMSSPKRVLNLQGQQAWAAGSASHSVQRAQTRAAGSGGQCSAKQVLNVQGQQARQDPASSMPCQPRACRQNFDCWNSMA